uniref:Uncharacterized protein n=1 Tax=Amphimedon queenslandica TaxID=400682 RepID=A0A1X7VIW3_AMPQE
MGQQDCPLDPTSSHSTLLNPTCPSHPTVPNGTTGLSIGPHFIPLDTPQPKVSFPSYSP